MVLGVGRTTDPLKNGFVTHSFLRLSPTEAENNPAF